MSQRKQLIGLSTLIASLALVVAFLMAPFGFAAQAQAQEEAPDSTLTHSVTVVGEGTVNIEPDIANATVGVEVVVPDLQEAVAQARETMSAVLSALQEAGVAEEDIQTTGFNIWAERNFPGPRPMPADDETAGSEDQDQVRYHVSNNVTVIIRDLNAIEDVLDAAIEAGANNIYGVNFSLDDPTVVESEARQRAVENARAKAEELAGLTDSELGDVISISEVIGQGGGYFGGNFAAAARDGLGGGGAGPISPGQLEMTMQLQITYELQ